MSYFFSKFKFPLIIFFLASFLSLASFISSTWAQIKPAISGIEVFPTVITEGEEVDILVRAKATSVYGIKSLQAQIQNVGIPTYYLTLYDDGEHGDLDRGDELFGNWIPASQLKTYPAGTYSITVAAEDRAGNKTVVEKAASFEIKSPELPPEEKPELPPEEKPPLKIAATLPYSQVETANCRSYGCTNSVTFRCSGPACNPISDGYLTISLKGDYDLYDERSYIYLDGKYLNSVGGLGREGSCSWTERGGWRRWWCWWCRVTKSEDHHCNSYGSRSFIISRSSLSSYLADGALTVEFHDSPSVNRCCWASHQAKLEFNYLLDTTPPKTTLNKYSPDPTNDSTPTYSGRSFDSESKVVKIEYRVDRGEWRNVDPFSPAFSVRFTFTTPALSDGTHTIEVRAKDEAGNWERPPYSSDTLTIDTIPPTLSNPQPTGVITTATPFLSVETNESAVCRFASQDQSFDSMTNTFSTADGRHHSALIGPLTQGNYTYYVRCRDQAGNKNPSSALIEFRYVSYSYPPSEILHFNSSYNSGWFYLAQTLPRDGITFWISLVRVLSIDPTDTSAALVYEITDISSGEYYHNLLYPGSFTESPDEVNLSFQYNEQELVRFYQTGTNLDQFNLTLSLPWGERGVYQTTKTIEFNPPLLYESGDGQVLMTGGIESLYVSLPCQDGIWIDFQKFNLPPELSPATALQEILNLF